MATQIIAAVTLFLTCAVGIWKFVARLKSEQRKLANEAKETLKDAQETGDKSNRLDAWMRINRVR